ncbi:hypothetical protein V9T40_010078 [Parthenolecanium corni]|uniref:Uncharacterized protein n=1 Tax=Parthenolecanium corni TaxID=536013 RepID=A0AAN9TM44_9HEMI
MKVDMVSDPSFTVISGYTAQNWNGCRKESNNNLDEDIMTDEDEFNFRKCRIDRKCLVKYKDSFLINSEIDSEALRTSGDKSEHAILRSLSLNTALDDVADMCDVCNIREKLGRNRRRPHKSTSRKFTKHEAMAIFYLGLIDFIGFCSMSVMAPFFPKEAERKGMDVSHAGYVFSFYALVMFLTAPVFGKIGVMETFAGLGMSIGPAFGGFLYAFGGFALPFYVLGTAMLLLIPLYVHTLPAVTSNRPTRHPGSFFKLVKIPSLLVIFLVVVVSSNAWSFLDPTLEPHLRESIICFLHFGIFAEEPVKTECPVVHPLLMKDKIAYYGALSNSSDHVNITVTNSGACEV